MTPDERREVPGLNPERADIIVAGLAVAAEVLRRLEARELVVSRYGIREGLLLEAARVAPTIADPGEARARSVRRLRRSAATSSSRTRRTCRRSRSRCSTRSASDSAADRDDRDAALRRGAAARRRLSHQLRAAPQALVSSDPARRPARHAAVGAGRDRERRALSSRQPRRRRSTATSACSTRRCAAGSSGLSAILRIADGFDRGHVSAVAELKVRWMQRAIRITPVPRDAAREHAARDVGREPKVGAARGGRRTCRSRSSRRTDACCRRTPSKPTRSSQPGRRPRARDSVRRSSRVRGCAQSTRPAQRRSASAHLIAPRVRAARPLVRSRRDARRRGSRCVHVPSAPRSHAWRLSSRYVASSVRSAVVQRRASRPARPLRRGGRSCAASSRRSRGRTPRRRRWRSARGASARGSGR